MENFTEQSSALFDSWLKTQREFVEKWSEAATQLDRGVPGLDWDQGMPKYSDDIFSIYNAWRGTFVKYFDALLQNKPFGTGRTTFGKLFGGADAYIKFYEFWEPLSKALREQAFSPESYTDLWDPAKFKEMMDKIFGFASQESVVEFHAQASKFLETLGLKAQGLVQPWSELGEKNAKALIDLYAGDTEAMMGMVPNVFAAFGKTFGKVFKMPAVGKDREQVELLLKTLDRYSVFLAKNAEFQHVIYVTGEKAMEKVVQAIAVQVKEKPETATIEEFFRLWTSKSEKEFLRLFRTEEFAQLQGTVLSAALDARRAFHQLMEVSLSDYPIALRSEMDDVYKSVYKLKRDGREARQLRSQVVGLTAEVDKLKKEIRLLQRQGAASARTAKNVKTAKTGGSASSKTTRRRQSRKEVK